MSNSIGSQQYSNSFSTVKVGTFGNSLREYERQNKIAENCPILPEQRWHGELFSGCDSKSTVQSLSNIRSINSPIFKSDRPEVMPVRKQNHIDGPKYLPNLPKDVDKTFRMTPDPLINASYSTRDCPINDQGEIKQGRQVEILEPNQQWVLSPFQPGVKTIGPQILSTRINFPALQFTIRPETSPIPNQASTVGPAQIIKKSTLCDSSSVSIKDMPDRMPAVPIPLEWAFSPESQYPLGNVNMTTLGKNKPLSTYNNTPSCTLGRRNVVNPIPRQSNDIGPAQFYFGNKNNNSDQNWPQKVKETHLFNPSLKTLPSSSNKSTGTNKLAERLYNKKSIPSLHEWLENENKNITLFETKSQKINLNLPSKYATAGKDFDTLQNDDTDNNMMSKSYPEVATVSEWLEMHGGGGVKNHKYANSFITRRPPPDRGLNHPQFLSKAYANPASPAAIAENAKRLVENRNREKLELETSASQN